MRAPHPATGMALALLLGAAGPLAADEPAGLIGGGDVALAFKYRFEFVEDEAFAEDARASTLRTRLTVRSGSWNGWSGLAEFDWITDVIWDDYNAGAGAEPDQPQFPVVADPIGTDLNQAWLQYSWHEDEFVRAGRQRIVYDDARFVGNVVWRQNEQTFDAAAVDVGALGVRLQYAWVWNVNRIFGNDVPAGDQAQDTHLVNAAAGLGDAGELVAYLYAIDNEDMAVSSTTTWGLRWTGEFERLPLAWHAEWARQTDRAENPVDFDADYWRIDAAWSFDRVTPYAGFESLGGAADRVGAAFRTPLATLHAFNGWADQFLVTPDAGIEDAFAGVRGGWGAWGWNVLWHDFSAEDGGADWGTELDAALTRRFGERYVLLLKLADFHADDPRYRDVFKAWVQFAANF